MIKAKLFPFDWFLFIALASLVAFGIRQSTAQRQQLQPPSIMDLIETDPQAAAIYYQQNANGSDDFVILQAGSSDQSRRFLNVVSEKDRQNPATFNLIGYQILSLQVQIFHHKVGVCKRIVELYPELEKQYGTYAPPWAENSSLDRYYASQTKRFIVEQ